MFVKTNRRPISFQLFVFYLTIISAFTGTLWMSVSVGSIHLFPYRFLLIFMWLLFVGGIFINYGRLNLSHIKVKLYMQFLALWLAYAFLSIMWAADKVEALRNSIFLFTGFSIVFFLVHYVRDLNHLKYLFWLWLLIFIVLIPVGLWEVTTGNHLSISGRFLDDYVNTKFAPTTVFHNQNDFSMYITLTLPLVLSWIRYDPKLYSRALGVLVFISGLLLLILTFSRACYIAVLTGLIFWFIFLLRLSGKVKALATTAFIFLLIVFTFPAETMDILTKIESRMASLSPIRFLEEDETRLNLIKNVLYFTAKSVGFGVGGGNVEYYMANYNIYPVHGVTNVHNWWAEILANYGLFILAGYFILYLSMMLNLWRVYKKITNRTEKMICEALLIGWVSFFMASGAPSSIIAFEPQWIYLGFVLAFLNYSRIKETVPGSKCIS
jgi:teichuronic acid biosynthesis protein TuaE